MVQDMEDFLLIGPDGEDDYLYNGFTEIRNDESMVNC